jgi:hypothetical protein
MRNLWVAMVCAVSLPGCVGASTAAPPPATPTPGVTGLLVAAPATLAFNSVGSTQPVSITETGFTGTFSVSGCAGVATFSLAANGALSVTSAGVGSCTLTVTDSNAHQATIAVSVTTLSVPVN